MIEIWFGGEDEEEHSKWMGSSRLRLNRDNSSLAEGYSNGQCQTEFFHL